MKIFITKAGLLGLVLFLSLVFIATLPSVIGAELLGTFARDSEVQLIQTCNNCTYCNLTSIKYPNATNIMINVVMVQDTTEFSYDLNGANTTVIGTYKYCYDCGNSVERKTGCIDFEITQTGSTLSTAQGIIYVVILVALIFVFVLSLTGAIKLPWKHGRSSDGIIVSVNDLRYLKIILYVVSYLVLMFFFGIMRSISANFLFMEGYSGVFNWLFWIMFSFLFPLMILSLVIIIATFLKNLKIKESIFRNVPLR